MNLNPVRLVAVATLGLATACSDAPTASSPAITPAATASPSLRLVERTPNSVRYRDRGAKPATGRAGSAALQSFALLGSDGVVVLDVHSAHAAAPAVPAGTLAKVQIKRFGSSGELAGTTNHKAGGATAQFTLHGLARHSRVQVQGNIRDIDRRRTDVVTLDDVVRLRPDLAVSDVVAPSEVYLGVPANVSATITELNGDVGETADCVLRVDGVEADRARGIWVDAGDAVNCAFTHVFVAAGWHAVTVGVENSWPIDDRASNNSATAPIRVLAAVDDAFAYLASVTDYLRVGDRTSRLTQRQPATGYHYEETVTLRDSVRIQSSSFHGYLAGALTFPIERLALEQRAGSAVLHSATLSGRAADLVTTAGVACAQDLFPGGYSVAVCSDPASDRSSISYQRYGAAVTYHGAYFGQSWFDDGSAAPPRYTSNVPLDYANVYGAVMLSSLGGAYDFDVQLRAGHTDYFKRLSLPLSAGAPQVVEVPFACLTTTLADGMLVEECAGSRHEVTLLTSGERAAPAGQP